MDGANDLVTQAIDAVVGETGASITQLDYPSWIGPVGEARDADLRDDGVHLTQAGIDETAPWLLEEMGLS